MIIKNPQPLDFSYIPRSLRFRESQIDLIKEASILPLQNGNCSTAVIYGDSGTGKTSTVKYLAREEHGVEIVYENGLSFPTIRQLLLDVASRFGKITAAWNMSYGEIFGLLNGVISNKGTGILIVVDECANIIKRDSEGLYNLLRSNELYGSTISSLLISMEDPSVFMSEIDRKSLGAFSSIYFNRYNLDELVSIVSERARLSIRQDAFDDSILRYIGEIAAQFGSARIAIELLQKSAYMCEYRNGNALSFDDVRAAKSMINPFVTESKLGELDAEELIVLLSVCSCLKSGPYTDMGCVLKNSKVMGEQYGFSIAESKTYRVISKLESVGLVESRIVGKGAGKGVSKLLSVNDVPISVLASKITNLLNR